MFLSKKINNRILNFSFILRGISSGVKFLFVLYLSSFTSGTVVGQYALIATITAITVQLIGFDVTTIIGRLIHKTERNGKVKLLESQYSFYLINYIVFFPLIFFLFLKFVKDDFFFAMLFGFTIVVEHFFTEVFRTLVSLVKVKFATIIQFLKSVPYIVFIILSSFFYDIDISIEFIIISWLMNLLLVFIFFFFKCWNGLNLDLYFLFDKKTYVGIKHLLFSAIPYFSITVLGVLFSQIDKFFINDYLGHELLGVYFTFFTICSVLTLFISLTVGVNQGPVVIKIFSQSGVGAYISARKRLVSSYFKYITIGFIVSLIVGSLYIYISNKGIYSDNYLSFFILLLSTAILAFGQVFRVDLYLLEKDKVLFLIYISSLLFNLLLLSILLPVYGVLGASITSLISTSFMVFTKIMQSKKYLKLVALNEC